ncbi:Hypothetical protein POVR1_LOCUS178 [uncultured virus]|nr:Hypothetical protein POVR1_LOCUS178 [uncultured virus]
MRTKLRKLTRFNVTCESLKSALDEPLLQTIYARLQKTLDLEPKIHELRVVLMKSSEVLAHLHEIGILHRDVSEDNVVYNPTTQEVKFIDYGMSQMISDLPSVLDVESYQELYYEGVKYAGDPESTPEYVLRLEKGALEFLFLHN